MVDFVVSNNNVAPFQNMDPKKQNKLNLVKNL
jgi:hypothetical protein